MEHVRRVREFIVESFLFGDDSQLTEGTRLLDEGVVDSTGFLELTLFIEKTFNIKIEKKELVPENLNTLDHIGRFLARKLEPVTGGQAVGGSET